MITQLTSLDGNSPGLLYVSAHKPSKTHTHISTGTPRPANHTPAHQPAFPFPPPETPDTWQPIQNPTLKGTVRGENQQNDKSKKMGMQGAGEDMGYRQHVRPLTVRGPGDGPMAPRA